MFLFNRILPSRRKGQPDLVILIILAAILVFGLLMLSSASSNLGVKEYGDAWFFLKNQAVKGFGVGLILFLAAYFIDYRTLKKLAVPLLVISVILLILIFTPLGEAQKGAARWLSLGPISLQPSEIVKFTFIIYLASWLSGREGMRRRKSFWEGFAPYLTVSAILSGLLLFQPATSIVVITMAAGLVVYFMSGARMSYILGVLLLGAIALAVLILATPYRLERVMSYLDFKDNQETEESLGASYHLNQALITIGSGGILGVGYGQSINKTKYLPEPIGDSIFAVIAEEFGFVGASILILMFLIIIVRIFILAQRHENDFARLTLIGFGSIIGIQTFVHIAAISGIIPLTGVPLPFISYGSTAMAVFLAMMGAVLNMSRTAR